MARSALADRSFHAVLDRLPKLRNRQFLAADVLGLSLTPALALTMRVEQLDHFAWYLPHLAVYTLVALIVRIGIFYPFGLYRRHWLSATVDELAQIVAAVAAATAGICILFFAGLYLAPSVFSLPRSLPFIDALLALGVVGGSRFSVRLSKRLLRPRPSHDAQRVLIIGAGEAGQRTVKTLQGSSKVGFVCVAFLDDDPAKQGVKILNLPVVGSRHSIPEAVHDQNIQQVIIAMPGASGEIIRQCVSLCEKANVPVKMVPRTTELVSGSTINQIRNVQIEDLLGREPVRTDIAAVRELVRGRRVLITGGGGSIGSELCRQVLRCAPAELALLGHGENSVFDIHNELHRLSSCIWDEASGDAASEEMPVLHALIADIRSPERIRGIMSSFRPDIIFHAAAHKHVPLMELNLAEAVSNNVFGTRNLLDAALAYGVDHFVMISSDKAVNPTSIMGATKRAAELLVLRAARQSGKHYVAVRFGNVLGSRGSVVLTFQRQISEGGPVTISHPAMRRYFMTIPEAVQLVLQASVLGRGGDIFVLDMGQPIKIMDLAKDLIELSGYEVGRDIKIVCTGIRPGEKLFEELFVPGETYEPTHHEKILIARNASSFAPASLDLALRDLHQAVMAGDCRGIVHLLQDLVPEFQPEGINASLARSQQELQPEDAVPSALAS